MLEWTVPRSPALLESPPPLQPIHARTHFLQVHMANRPVDEAVVIKAAFDLIASVPYKAAPGMNPATFVTYDPDGFPSARVLVPRHISKDLTEITLNTRMDTNKFLEIQGNPKSALCYHDQRGKQGWLTLKGTAHSHAFGRPITDEYVDVHFRVEKLEIMTYNDGGALKIDRARPVVLVRRGDTPGGPKWVLRR